MQENNKGYAMVWKTNKGKKNLSMTRFVVLFLLFACIGSCDTMEDPINRFNKKLKIDTTGVLQKDIPEKQNDSSAYWHAFTNLRNRLGLPTLENGSEVFEIRVWEQIEWGLMVLSIKNRNNKWAADNSIYWAVSSKVNELDSIVVNNTSLRTPKTGWKKFLNKLIDKGILDLKDYSKIPGYFNGNDLPFVKVEIATKNYYRHYSMTGVNKQPTYITDAKSMTEILDLIRNEFPEIEPQLTRCSRIAVSSWKGESPARDSSLNETTPSGK